jgi:lipoprotein LprG
MWKAEPMVLRRLLLACLLAVGLVTSGCGGDDTTTPDLTPAQVMEAAKKALDETAGVQLDLVARSLPSDVEGILSGTGIGTHAPAFKGSIKVQTHGISADVPVIAVDGKVYAQTPFAASMSVIDPGKYGAPDPAALFTATTGISSLLTEIQGLTRGDSVRGGANNDEVLTEYTGTLPASAVTRVIPSATGDPFTVSFQVAADNELREAVLTGEFYPGAGDVTYTLTLTNYGVTQDITAP